MSWVMAAAGAVSLGTSAVKMHKGKKQIKKGEQLDAQNKLTPYSRPVESVEALKLAEIANNNSELPGQQIYENKIESVASTGLDNLTRNSGSSGDLLTGAIKLDANKHDSINQLNIAAAKQQMIDRENLQKELGVQAGYTDKEYQLNEYQPFKETEAKAASLISAGNQNFFSGVDDIGGIATNVLMSGLDFDQNPTMGDKSGAIQPVANTMTPSTKTPQLPTLGSMNAMNGKMVFDPSTKKWMTKFF